MGYEKYTLNVENILNTYCKKYDYEFSIKIMEEKLVILYWMEVL